MSPGDESPRPTVFTDGPLLAGVAANARWGDFQLSEELGRGAMGAVFRARQISLGREVALKLMLGMGDEHRQRFEREARALAQVDSPHVVRVHSAGVHLGLPYIVMEYVTGTDLSRRLKSGWRPSPDEALVVVLEAARGLRAVHDRGIVHRDIKPANLMLPVDGVVKLMDFSLVRLAHEAEMTKSGAVMGTAHYFSPEQARGLRCDHRSDVYSLGVVFYELLCGQVPFASTDIATLMFQHAYIPPAPLRGGGRRVPAGHAAIAMRCLRKEPSQRYQSSAELIADLERLQRGEFRVRSLRLPAIAAVVLLAVTVGIAAFLWPGAIARSTELTSSPLEPVVATPAASDQQIPPSARLAAMPIEPMPVPLEVVTDAPPEPVATTTAPVEDLVLVPAVPIDAVAVVMGEPRSEDSVEPPVVASDAPIPNGLALPPAVAATTAIAVEPTTSIAAEPEIEPSAAPAADPVVQVVLPAPTPEPTPPAVPAPPADQPTRVPGLGEVERDPAGYFADLVVIDERMRFRWCPSGSYVMGSPPGERERADDEKPHRVTVSRGFWLADSECTQELWRKVLDENPSKVVGPRLPVHNLSRADCERFCLALTRLAPDLLPRLPWEAEWEYAGRAGGAGSYPTGVVLDRTLACIDTTAPRSVGSYAPNPWGLHDLAGNVGEWCGDTYADYVVEAVDPRPTMSGDYGVSRGGFWEDSIGACRSANRFKHWIDRRNRSLGLRLALDAPADQKR